MAAVTISYNDLVNAPDSLQKQIEQAFGNAEDALGVIIIKDLPEQFPKLREDLLKLADKFASLPKETREKYSRKEVQYMFGWSHGKEIMNGKPDIYKGSYYANPLVDHPDVSEELRQKNWMYYGDNVWPEKSEPGMENFEQAFKNLGKLIHSLGLLLAKACESFVSEHVHTAVTSSNSSASISDLIATSQCNKARLLHYFPPSASTEGENGNVENGVQDDACGIHLDHSLLTGLCSAMYLDHSENASEPKVVPAPDPKAGLWICPRRQGSEPIKVSIPADCLGFQTGEALQLLTAGKLAATPHFVRAGQDASSVSRETFAFFLQPDVDRVVGADGETFGQFSERIMREHYEDGTGM
ncbi:hypothetical protein QFC20_002356 [Naganishia adeliensis]|uniref:Uncharacterized protein n=1 Tax=Naganishia adeliensis TaxID=92952 RepID=A0ACC2WLF9_9TREE|nr:hypothetical protein QFC20_002356 [Naganishia adeliensis]